MVCYWLLGHEVGSFPAVAEPKTRHRQRGPHSWRKLVSRSIRHCDGSGGPSYAAREAIPYRFALDAPSWYHPWCSMRAIYSAPTLEAAGSPRLTVQDTVAILAHRS